ncbi:methionine--tRNA ligase [uncultured Clostridium sp.]|jgi:methionyl-tRNA synthetase|uniref:methionine--tRNA ligase n=1 Tax=uncultured Clostridium sp. TaxID=59620 RepID=UPI0026268E4F|nr:methionine--tRNA ligase [uncultured Clostridium sp.]
MKVVIGNAWPYANGPLHIGRISSWLPGDVVARYHRAKGDEVVFVSGSDCHGELVLKKANSIKKSPKFVSDYYHEKFKENFIDLDFSFDNFAKTSGEYHKKQVKIFIEQLYMKGLIYSKNVEIDFCDNCNEEIGDRFIVNNLHIVCGKKVSKRTVDKLFFKLSTFENYLNEIISKNLEWRENAIKLTQRYLDEGLRDRVLSREIEWGIEIPIKDFEDKKVFVWIEAVMGYMTASKEIIEERKEDFEEYWNNENSRVYLFHGKENIPFHTVVMPSIIAGLGYLNCNLRILSSEHMDLEGKKFSSNRNWVVWLDHLLKNYETDTIRYYLLTHGAEKRNSNFTWRDFINTHNIELLGIHGNFINRTLSFIDKYYNGKLPKQRLNKSIEVLIKEVYESTSKDIEKGDLVKASRDILNLSIKGNEYFDNEKPWIAFRNDPSRCKEVIYNCALIVLNLSNLLNPIIPKTASEIRKMLNMDEISYEFEYVQDFNISKVKFLFTRIEKRKVSEEIARLKMNRNK